MTNIELSDLGKPLKKKTKKLTNVNLGLTPLGLKSLGLRGLGPGHDNFA